jgi:hypothetical protein
VLGTLLRLLACVFDPPMHPDEYFQYTEPAWWHLSGAGLATWEWDDGVRSWVLPTWNGGWLSLLMALGVDDGPTLGLALKVHWALVNVALIWLAWRGGNNICRLLAPRASREPGDDRPAGFEGGLLAALLCACFTILVCYSAHTLSELPSMLCLIAGLVLVSEIVERPRDEDRFHLWSAASAAGLLISMGACLRIANGPLTLVAPVWLLLTRRGRSLKALLVAALLPILIFAAVDRVTWGVWAGSFIEYVKFNFIQSGAADFGTEPADWYLGILHSRAPAVVLVLLAIAALGWRATWPYLLSALGMLAYLSSQPHKEERFVVAFWPLLLIAAAGTLGAWIANATRDRGDELPAKAPPASTFTTRIHALTRAQRTLFAGLFAALVLADGAVHFLDGVRTPRQDWIDAQVWIAREPDLSGMLIDWPINTAGGLWLGHPVPILDFEADLLANPLVSHVLVPGRSKRERQSLAAGFVSARTFGHCVVLKRAR